MGDQGNNARGLLGGAAHRTLLITLASISSLGLAGWAWMQLIETNPRVPQQQSLKIIAAGSASALLIGAEHRLMRENFAETIGTQKAIQASIQATYEKLDCLSRKMRESGNNINLIISQDSSLSKKRHLNRIPYRSLIEYEPKHQRYIVKDGANKGLTYKPQIGDVVANIDKGIKSLNPILGNLETELIYRHNRSERSGVIVRVTGITPQGTTDSPFGDKVPHL